MQKKRIRKLCLVILVVLIGMIGCGKKGGDSLREIPVSDQEETPEEEQQKEGKGKEERERTCSRGIPL